jgi:hypothetical protein
MHRGSCLCGAVTIEIDGEIGAGYYCHCQRCRKASGSVMAANALIDPASFRITSGQQVLRTYYAETTGLERSFCSVCGSPILSFRPATGRTAVRLGTLDSDPGHGPGAHIFMASRAGWENLDQDLPCHAEFPPS